MRQSASTNPSVVLEDGVTRRDAFAVAGISARIGKANPMDIPALWPKLMQQVPFDGQKGPVGFGLCYDSDPEGSFIYMAGVEIAPDRKPPAGLTLMQVPAQTYLVFRITLGAGEIHPQVKSAMQYIFSEGLPNSGHKPTGGIDLEIYDQRFEPGKAGSVLEFCIPVEG